MNKDLQAMETLLDLFNHEGWTIFIDENEALSKSLKGSAYMECHTDQEWQQRRGALVALDRILTYEQTTKYVYENWEEADEELRSDSEA